MNFTNSKFDVKKLTRLLHKAAPADETVKPEGYDGCDGYVGIDDLKDCFVKMYSDLLKHKAINIREVNFDSFMEYELDDFYAFLETYNHELFNFGETMLSFAPATITKPIFI